MVLDSSRYVGHLQLHHLCIFELGHVDLKGMDYGRSETLDW